MSDEESSDRIEPAAGEDRRWHPLAVLGLYTLAIVAATWPFATTFASRLPSLGDPLQHLWVMRWYRSCLLEGRSPLVCPDLQYPVGAPIGNFSPLHLQSLVYLVASAFSSNDVLCFNVVWLVGLLLTGMGTFALARHVLRHDAGAALAGLLAMLSGPVLVHSHAHVELIYVGGFPLFLLAWMRFLDRPGFGRMLAAAAGFVLVASCAAYFMVFAIFPAALYLPWKAIRQPRGERRRWFRGRLAWSLGFAAATLPAILLLFAGQVWNVLHGQAGLRPKAEFDQFGAPWWAYLVPVPGQALQGFLPLDPYGAAGVSGEGMAYLGVVTLVLVARAGLGGVRFRESGYWWATAAMLVVLSLGSTLRYGSHRVELPAGWLRDLDWFVPFRLIRAPGRFKLFVAVCTAILAGASWADLSRRWPRPATRRLAFALVAALAVADLAHVPYSSEPIPPMPAAYSWIRSHAPDAAWVDVPQMNSGNALAINSMYTYWQALHRGRTTAGYSGHQNRPQDDLLSWNSPFIDTRMAEPSFPATGEESFDLVRLAGFRDYAWLYLTTHNLRFAVLHRWVGQEGAGSWPRYGVDRMAERLSDAICFDDGKVAVVDRDRLDPPRSPVVLGSEGWGGYHLLPRDGFVRLATRSSWLETYNPDPDRPLVFAIEARALGKARRVALLDGQTELASWAVAPGSYEIYQTPPFRLPRGRGRLRIEVDGAVDLDRLRKRFEGELHPASLIVKALCLRPAGAEDPGHVRAIAAATAAEPAESR
ncbi:hypothetical protein [Tautonia sociabilis]|uniref:Glycosyltransferase RgtA/B/C/D-like domain-containing protein n=1 Tax=Tautonia sociabilis TaxID=2080755 RepID=A0A432MGP0_9BACT|nr:hypothetical protein [Tautonia sociabilis]RUL85737.1 hypothetical protein TsocGM_17855 [Tautonia sociabilis]